MKLNLFLVFCLYLTFFIILLVDDAGSQGATWAVSISQNKGVSGPSLASPRMLSSRDGDQIFVASLHEPRLTVVSTTDAGQHREISLPSVAHHLMLTPDGKYLIAGHPQTDAVTVISTESLSVVNQNSGSSASQLSGA